MTASRPSPAAAPTHEVRFVTLIGAKHETLDEVVGTGAYHAEIMDDDYLWLQLGPDMFAVHATKGRFGRPRLTFSLTEKNAFAASDAPESAPPTELRKFESPEVAAAWNLWRTHGHPFTCGGGGGPDSGVELELIAANPHAYWQGKHCQVWYPNLILQSKDPNVDELRKILANAPRKEPSDTAKDSSD